MAENGPCGLSGEMRNRKKKGSTGDTGGKPEPKNTETPSKEAEETKDAPVKVEASKPKPTRLRACAWTCGKIVLFLLAAAVIAIVFLMVAMPRIMSELQVIFYLFRSLFLNIVYRYYISMFLP